MRYLSIVLFSLLDSLAAALYTTVHRWRYVKVLDRVQAWTYNRRFAALHPPQPPVPKPDPKIVPTTIISGGKR